MSAHYKEVCASCGTVSECRCMAPSKREVRVATCGACREALAARDHLKDALGEHPWLRGMDLTKTLDGSVAVLVFVSTVFPDMRRVIPPMLGKVPVVIRVVGDISAQ